MGVKVQFTKDSKTITGVWLKGYAGSIRLGTIEKEVDRHYNDYNYFADLRQQIDGSVSNDPTPFICDDCRTLDAVKQKIREYYKDITV